MRTYVVRVDLGVGLVCVTYLERAGDWLEGPRQPVSLGLLSTDKVSGFSYLRRTGLPGP